MSALFPSDRKVLKILKKVQSDEAHYFIIDERYIYRCDGFSHNHVQNAKAYKALKKLYLKPGSLEAALNTLKEQSFIEKAPGGPAMKVTHSGWNESYMHRKSIRDAILQSIVCPILVSIATTLIALFFKGYL